MGTNKILWSTKDWIDITNSSICNDTKSKKSKIGFSIGFLFVILHYNLHSLHDQLNSPTHHYLCMAQAFTLSTHLIYCLYCSKCQTTQDFPTYLFEYISNTHNQHYLLIHAQPIAKILVRRLT